MYSDETFMFTYTIYVRRGVIELFIFRGVWGCGAVPCVCLHSITHTRGTSNVLQIVQH